MNNFEPISYQEYPEDQYTKAIAIVRIDGKHCVSYAKKQTKDGNTFWAPATHSVTENGKKTFIEGYLNESRSTDKALIEFVKQMANKHNYSMQGSLTATNGFVKTTQSQQTFSQPSGGAVDEQLPF